jgi:hypothetical protein
MDSYGNAEHTDSVPVVKFLSGFISKGKTQWIERYNTINYPNWNTVLVSFTLLLQNTWDNNLLREKVYFGS